MVFPVVVAVQGRAGKSTQKTDPDGVQSCVQNNAQPEAVWADSIFYAAERNTGDAGELRDTASSRKPLQNQGMGEEGLEPPTPCV